MTKRNFRSTIKPQKGVDHLHTLFAQIEGFCSDNELKSESVKKSVRQNLKQISSVFFPSIHFSRANQTLPNDSSTSELFRNK